MSFYSYKNANAEASPGSVGGNVLTGLNKRVCIQVKNVYDSCLCQEQLDDKKIVISNIVPVLPGDCHGNCAANCNAAGMDVETSQGAEHFSLQETDQINLTTAYNAILSGAAGYPYHADGALCRMFTAEEITAISNASIAHKLYHTTLCNHLLTWARRAETAEELAGIAYTAEGLPEDLAANMAQVLAEAQNV